MSDDFSSHPVSVGEMRATRTRNGADWTPREALIELLRDIDAGRVDPDALIICYRMRLPAGGLSCCYSASSPDLATSIGLVGRVTWMLNENAR